MATSIHTIKLWIKAFVPHSYEQALPVPGAGEHAGKSMLHHQWVVDRYFLTNQRTFSDDIHAEARMHSEIEIDLARGREVYQFHHCYDTVEIDCRTGEEKCRQQADTSRMQFHDFEAAVDLLHYAVKIKAGARNPCIKLGLLPIAPNLDYTGAIKIALSKDTCRADVTFNGKVEKFPAFEMYASANGGAAVPVFQLDVAPHASLRDLPGDADRVVHGRAVICA